MVYSLWVKCLFFSDCVDNGFSLSEEVHSKFILYHDKHVLSISTKFKSLEFSYEAGQVRSGHLIVSAEFIFYEVL